jgi:hypothetical protein
MWIQRQAGLPRSLPLFRYAPRRDRFPWRDWDPELVHTSRDLPPYLILGSLARRSFRRSARGWSARWQGTETDTRFHVAYDVDARRWRVRQTWCGVDGGFSDFRALTPLDKVIAQALNNQFPWTWDRAAKASLEASYQLTLIEQPANTCALFGIPDGAFRTIAFPVAVGSLRAIGQWIQDSIARHAPDYPVTAEARLVFQAVNYLEAKAPAWTARAGEVFLQSVVETGLAPCGLPVREVADDGSAAWTLRREVYFVFINLPFAGLTDFLARMAAPDGPIRAASDPDLRFELRPVVMPAMFEAQAQGLAVSDQGRTTRSFLQFAPPGAEKTVPTIEQAVESEGNAAAALAQAEAISAEVVAAIEQSFQRVTRGDAA